MIYWAVFLFISLGDISWWYYCVDGTFWRFLCANCRAIHVVHRLCWYERLRPTPELESTQSSRRLLSLLTPTANLGWRGGLSKLPLGSVICYKDPQNSLKLCYTQLLWFIIGIKINQRKRCLEQSPGVFQRWSFLFTLLVTCYSLAGMYGNMGGVLPTKATQPGLGVHNGTPLHLGWLIDWLSTWLISVSSLNTAPHPPTPAGSPGVIQSPYPKSHGWCESKPPL